MISPIYFTLKKANLNYEVNILNRNYVLTTPCKNEESNLLKLIESVCMQTIKPKLWIIVDDGSTDNTSQIIDDAKKKHAWIQSIHLDSSTRDLGKHIYYVYNEGFEWLKKYSKLYNISYEYIGNIDADMILQQNYFFDKLLSEFENNHNIGVMSSRIYSVVNDKLLVENVKEPMGSPRIWRKKCFDETDGYLISYSADSVSNILVKMKGWDTKILNNISVVQSRRTSSAEGMWKGYFVHGKSAYYRNYHPIFVIAKGVYLSFKKPFYIGAAYLYGYFVSILIKPDKLDNKKVTTYYHQKHKEVLQHHWNALKIILKCD